MKLIYAQGFSKTEKLEWKTVVFNNIIQSFRLIFDAMQELDIEFELKENEASSLPLVFPRRQVGSTRKWSRGWPGAQKADQARGEGLTFLVVCLG